MKRRVVALLALPLVLGAVMWPVARRYKQHRKDNALFEEVWKEAKREPVDEHKIRQLIAEGASVRYKGTFDLTALHGANRPSTCKLLLDNGADINAADDEDKQTPLMIAAWDGNAPVVRLLISRGANVNQKDAGGKSALSFLLWISRKTRATGRGNGPIGSLPPSDWENLPYTPNGEEVVRLLKAAGAK